MPFQQFGLVTAITIVYALIAAVLVVPWRWSCGGRTRTCDCVEP